jgi:hypothetical protein
VERIGKILQQWFQVERKKQCTRRWFNSLDPISTGQAPGRTSYWTVDEDEQLKDAVQRHGGKNWIGTAALVPRRTENQCFSRWHDAWDPTSVDKTSLSIGQWTADEDDHLKDAVQRHSGKEDISAIVPGRTKIQCISRWFNGLDSTSTGQIPGRTGKWTADED